MPSRSLPFCPQEKPAGKQAESWAAELKSRELQTVDIGPAVGAALK